MKQFLFALLFLVSAASGCAADDPISSHPNAAVGVIASGCSLVDRVGTGAPVLWPNESGLIVTSAHTVAGATQILIELPDRGRINGELVAFDPLTDVAIVRADVEGGTPLGAAVTGSLATIVTWNPKTGFTPTTAIIGRRLLVTIEDIYVEGLATREAFELNATAKPGDSGAPVLSADGSLVGIIYATSRDRPGVGFAVAATEIRRSLEKIGSTPIDGGRCG